MRFRSAAAFAADSGEEPAGEAAAAVLPQLGEAVKVAVEATAASAAGNMLDMERTLSLQADAIADAAEANRGESKTSLEAKLDAVMAMVVDLQAQLRSGMAHTTSGTLARAELPRPSPHIRSFPPSLPAVDPCPATSRFGATTPRSGARPSARPHE